MNPLNLIRGLQRPGTLFLFAFVYTALVIYNVVAQGQPIDAQWKDMAISVVLVLTGVRTAEKANPNLPTP